MLERSAGEVETVVLEGETAVVGKKCWRGRKSACWRGKLLE